MRGPFLTVTLTRPQVVLQQGIRFGDVFPVVYQVGAATPVKHCACARLFNLTTQFNVIDKMLI